MNLGSPHPSLTHSLKGGGGSPRGCIFSLPLAGAEPSLVPSGSFYGKHPDWEHTLDSLEFPGPNA